MSPDINSLQFELKILRRKLKIFQHHHQNCSIATPALPPIDDETEPSTELQIIPFSVQSTEVSKPCGTTPRWRRIADQILKDVLIPEKWIERREELGLHTTQGAAWLTAAIFGATVRSFRQQATHQLGAGVMASAQAYAMDTKATQEYADKFCQIHSFMELVFVSLCVVLEALAYPVDDINEAMRICLSNSEDINLQRLRRGALWVNGTIVDMCNAGVGDKGTELFFMYGASTSKYSILADNTDSKPYFIEMLKNGLKDSQDSPEPEVPTLTSLFIPAYINVLVGDEITLSQICDALGYGDKYVTESTTRLCERYSDLALKGSSEPVTISLMGSKKRKRLSKNPSVKRNRPSNNIPPSRGNSQIDVGEDQQDARFISTQNVEEQIALSQQGTSNRPGSLADQSHEDASSSCRNGTGPENSADHNPMGVLLTAAEYIAGSVSTCLTPPRADPAISDPYSGGWNSICSVPSLYGSGWDLLSGPALDSGWEGLYSYEREMEPSATVFQ